MHLHTHTQNKKHSGDCLTDLLSLKNKYGTGNNDTKRKRSEICYIIDTVQTQTDFSHTHGLTLPMPKIPDILCVKQNKSGAKKKKTGNLKSEQLQNS